LTDPHVPEQDRVRVAARVAVRVKVKAGAGCDTCTADQTLPNSYIQEWNGKDNRLRAGFSFSAGGTCIPALSLGNNPRSGCAGFSSKPSVSASYWMPHLLHGRNKVRFLTVSKFPGNVPFQTGSRIIGHYNFSGKLFPFRQSITGNFWCVPVAGKCVCPGNVRVR